MSTRIFYNSQSEAIRLGRRIGVGGEGTVYELQDRSDLVAKIYHKPPSPEKAEKLMVLSRLGSERLFNLSAWPVDVLREQNSGELRHIAGFLMKKIGEAEEVHTLHSPKSRLQKFPEASWAFLIHVATNIARAVSVIHEHGYVVGDVNPKNILVTRKATVYLLDCDSFQVSADGKTYRCEGGFPEYTPPELQGVAFKDVDRTQRHDCFGLAVVIFQLLFLGRHPFSGKFLGAGEMPLERAIRELRFAYGSDAPARQMAPPPGTLPLAAVPHTLNRLFRCAFLSPDRPQPLEWIEPLESLAKSLGRCKLHSGHHYFRELAECPWCDIEMRARIRLFNFVVAKPDQNRSYFRLDEVWDEIEKIPSPPASQAIAQKVEREVVPYLKVSKNVKDFLDSKRGRFYLSLCFSGIAGFLSGYVGGFCLGILLLLVTSLIARKISGIAPKSSNRPQSLLQSQPPSSEDPFIRQIEVARENVKEALRRVEEHWQKEASFQRFVTARTNLRTQRETYLNLPKIRERKLNQLEIDARARQFQEHLRQFAIDEVRLEGVSLGTRVLLRSYGVETAADLTKPKLEQLRTVDEVGAKKLREWRRQVGQKFAFDPAKAVSPAARLTVERELDELRIRLEYEMSSGAYYLRRLTREIEESQRKLQPQLVSAHTLLAQTELDYKTATKFFPTQLATVLLIFSFVVGLFLQPDRPVYREPDYSTTQTYSGSNPPPQPALESPVEDPRAKLRKAQQFYNQGVELSKQNKLKAAAEAFQKSVELAPDLQPAQEALGLTLFRLKRYDEAVAPLEAALLIKPTFQAHYTLGRVYIEQEVWGAANTHLVDALALIPSQSNWKDDYTRAYDYWGQTLKEIGWIESSINSFERDVKVNPKLEFERFELGSLYLWVWNGEGAYEQYQILKRSNPSLARELQKLMIKHGVRRK